MDAIIGFVIGLCVGVWFGLFIFAVLTASGRNSREEQYKEETRKHKDDKSDRNEF